MMVSLKRVLKLLLPPVIVQLVRKAGSKQSANTFEGVYTNFEEIPGLTGYDSESSLANIENETLLKLKEYESSASLPVAHNRSQITNSFPLLIASLNTHKKIVLDYGGGGGGTYLDCLGSINMEKVEYYVHDLPETMEMGRKIFSDPARDQYNIHFVDDVSEIDEIDIVYLGSVLQYLTDYKTVLLSIIKKQPRYFLITDNFMSKHLTFVTTQVNMPGRRMAYWVIQLEEIDSLFRNNGYRLIYRSANYQPFHHFNNFPFEYRVNDSCNLLFERLDQL